MVHDSEIIDFFESRRPLAFEGHVFRATRINLDPLAPSTSGGRWMIPERTPVLYTSTSRDGAIAEIRYHWGQLTPPPSKNAVIHELRVAVSKTVRIDTNDFPKLRIDAEDFGGREYKRTQEIGAAAAFLGFDGLLVPSARSTAQHLILFAENHSFDSTLQLISSADLPLTFSP